MDPCLFGRNILMGWDLTSCTSVHINLDLSEDWSEVCRQNPLMRDGVYLPSHHFKSESRWWTIFLCSHSHNN